LARAAADRAARQSYGKLVAFLAARGRDVAGAEDALADAFAVALAVWPIRGVPANPEGWLVTAARRKLVDAARRRQSADSATSILALIAEEIDAAESESIPDRRLALMFACAHPAIDEPIRAPLILQTILGLDAAQIGSAFLVSPAAMGQRLARAKAKIRLAGVRSASPSATRRRNGSAPCSKRFTPPFPTAGTRPFPTIRAAAICPARRSGSGASSSASRLASRRPRDCSP
jgi:RNA polymerase sigma-70 factor (ECF subfamily)